MKGAISLKKLLNIKCVFLFPLQILFEVFFILRIIQRDVIDIDMICLLGPRRRWEDNIKMDLQEV
jgi:hypothetical protein